MSLGVVLVMLRASRPSAVSAARKGLIATTLITGLAASITLAVYYLRRELTYPADLYKISSSFCLALVFIPIPKESATLCTAAAIRKGYDWGAGWPNAKDWQQAMFALEILGILCSVPSLVFAVLYVFLPATSGKKWVKFVTLTLALVAVTSIKSPKMLPEFELGWSFAMAIIGGLLHLAASIFFTLDAML
nr:hypothetical protein BaRGS_007428 [Batillaria attramentaria]